MHSLSWAGPLPESPCLWSDGDKGSSSVSSPNWNQVEVFMGTEFAFRPRSEFIEYHNDVVFRG